MHKLTGDHKVSPASRVHLHKLWSAVNKILSTGKHIQWWNEHMELTVQILIPIITLNTIYLMLASPN